MNIISSLARLSLFIGTLLPAALVSGADRSHCKNIGDPSARLVCYDQAAGVVDEILQDQAVAADAESMAAADVVAESSTPFSDRIAIGRSTKKELQQYLRSRRSIRRARTSTLKDDGIGG